MTEEWRRIPKWPYLVSDLGRVMRIEPGRHTQPGHVLRTAKLRTGQQVRLTQMVKLNGERVSITKTWLVHRLVWTVFVGEPGMHAVKPLNGDLSDSRLSNLSLGKRGRKPAQDAGLELRRAG